MESTLMNFEIYYIYIFLIKSIRLRVIQSDHSIYDFIFASNFNFNFIQILI